jgi:hypothetical protein
MAIDAYISVMVAWNVVTFLGLILFAFFAFQIKSPVMLRRYPCLTIVQALVMNLWVNTLLQHSSLRFLEPDEFAPMGTQISRFFISMFCCPMWTVRSFILLHLIPF